MCSSSSWFGINWEKFWLSRRGGEEVNERPFQGTVEAWMRYLGCGAGAGVAFGGSRVSVQLPHGFTSLSPTWRSLHCIIPLFNPNEHSS